jgi:hypothetical protein
LAQVGSFEFWLIVGPGPLSAPFEVWLIVSPDPLSAHYGVWPIIGSFESAFTSHLRSLLPLSPLVVSRLSTIYGPFPASATAVILVSNFKLKVTEYSTLSLRRDVKIFYSLYLLSFLLEFISYLN